MSDPIDPTAATMSTSHGPWKLLTAYWSTPKLSPETRQAGHTSNMPRHPLCAATSQKGTSHPRYASKRMGALDTPRSA